ncbi:hypothetical protein LC612_43515, partial [Nostoc sp. CHAB 5834]|nr:hypothetical protein [Nostoc sp. CHAB 5834]
LTNRPFSMVNARFRQGIPEKPGLGRRRFRLGHSSRPIVKKAKFCFFNRRHGEPSGTFAQYLRISPYPI